MNREPALYFRDQFREARYHALEDAEGYQQILFVLERLGAFLYRASGDLGKYQPCIRKLVKCYHPNAGCPHKVHGHYFINFDTLYRIVRNGRNDALHQGAVARTLASHAVQICIILEDALIVNAKDSQESLRIQDYMTRHPVCSYTWQPIGFIRQIMLEKSFSYLPFQCGDAWHIVSDYDIARYVHCNIKTSLNRTLECIIGSQKMSYREAIVVAPDTTVREALKDVDCQRWPILVKRDGCEELLGIVTPFDLM